jgi:hypothetical protein
MVKKIAMTLVAAGLVMVAIALAPAVPTALAVATPTQERASLLADPSCAAFETWFLDPGCSRSHSRKASRATHRVAQQQ